MRTRRSMLSLSGNTIIVALALAFTFRPTSPIWRELDDWRASRAASAQLKEMWPILVGGGDRIDSAGKTVRLVVFSDYQCPYCKRFSAALDTVLREMPEIGVVLRHYPIRGRHSLAEVTARAMICSDAKHAHVANRHLYDAASSPDTLRLLDFLPPSAIGDTAAYITCLRGSGVTARLEQDRVLADELGVRSTPSMFTPTQRVRGALSARDLRHLLQRP